MKTLFLFVMIATIIDGLVDYGQTIWDMFKIGDYKKAVKQICAIILGLIFAFQLKLAWLTWCLTPWEVVVKPMFDMIMTGIFLSRGSNFAFDFGRMIYRLGRKEQPDDNDDSFWDMFEFDKGDDNGTSTKEDEN